RKLGKATAGLRDVEAYWENVATTDAGVCIPTVLIGGREDLAKEVRTFLASKNVNLRPLGIPCRSPAEVVPFAVASVVDANDESGIARTVPVDSTARCDQLIVEESDLGLIVAPQEQLRREQLQQAGSGNHRVVDYAATGDVQ